MAMGKRKRDRQSPKAIPDQRIRRLITQRADQLAQSPQEQGKVLFGELAGYFPAYAPELNPAEYVWAQADRALANGGPDDLVELRQRLDSAIRRLRRSQHLLWSCIYASDLPWAR
jgi:broad specificity phosphatase PhoE